MRTKYLLALLTSIAWIQQAESQTLPKLNAPNRWLSIGIGGDYGFGTALKIDDLGQEKILEQFMPESSRDDDEWYDYYGKPAKEKTTVGLELLLAYRWEDYAGNLWSVGITGGETRKSYYMENKAPFYWPNINNYIVGWHTWYTQRWTRFWFERAWAGNVGYYYAKLGLGFNTVPRQGLITAKDDEQIDYSSNYTYLGTGAIWEGKYATTPQLSLTPEVGVYCNLGPDSRYILQLGFRYNIGLGESFTKDYSMYENGTLRTKNQVQIKGNYFAVNLAYSVPLSVGSGSRFRLPNWDKPTPKRLEKDKPLRIKIHDRGSKSRTLKPLKRTTPNSSSTTTVTRYKPNNVVLLIDASRSMSKSHESIGTAMDAILATLPPSDHVSVITYNTKAHVRLKWVRASDRTTIVKKIKGIHGRGDTYGNEALEKAYDFANNHYVQGANNVIILATDGAFSVHSQTTAMVKSNAANNGIRLSVLDLSKSVTEASVMKNLTLIGKGSYMKVNRKTIVGPLSKEFQVLREL